jgi:hypothetical protein
MKHGKIDLSVDCRRVKVAMSQEICDFLDADSLLNHMGGNRMAENMSASRGDLHPCLFESPADDVSDNVALKWLTYAEAMTNKQVPLFGQRSSVAQIGNNRFSHIYRQWQGTETAGFTRSYTNSP